MARTRVRAVARKAALLASKQQLTEADVVAVGVRAVAREIAPLVKPGALYWTAPLQYVVEQMAPRVCAEHGVDASRAGDVAGYLLAGMNEYIVALVGEFDIGQFEAWTAAAERQEAKRG